MKHNYINYGVLMLGGMLLATSCVDDNYDLNDIDTTTAIKLVGLEVPVKLNDIELNKVLDIDENDPDAIIQIYTSKDGDRYYAIKKSGYFEADPVKIAELQLTSYVTVPLLNIPAANGDVEDATVKFQYLIEDANSSLLYLTYFGLKEDDPMEINLTITPSNLDIKNLKIQIPSTYSAFYNNKEYNDGIIPVEIENGGLKYPIYVRQMQFVPNLPNNDGTLSIEGKIGIASATIDSKGEDMTFQFTMSPFTANVVSGSINYEVESPYIKPVELNDLPEFLTEGETNLVLQNPQLYLDFTSLYGANYNTGITISPEGKGTHDTYIRLEPFQEAIVLAPDASNLGLPTFYESPVLQNVTELQSILSGEGIPQVLNIKMDDNTYLDGEIQDLVLGTEPGIALGGNYTFFTPLAFAPESKIIYNKVENDFFGDDMEDVVVSELQLTATATTNLPFAVKVYVYPLDKEGNRLTSASGDLPSNAQKSSLDIHFKNEFRGLDGVEITVTADDMSGDSLSPDQFIRLEDIRAIVSGEYVTKL